jgi:hypothetical protein
MNSRVGSQLTNALPGYPICRWCDCILLKEGTQHFLGSRQINIDLYVRHEQLLEQYLDSHHIPYVPVPYAPIAAGCSDEVSSSSSSSSVMNVEPNVIIEDGNNFGFWNGVDAPSHSDESQASLSNGESSSSNGESSSSNGESSSSNGESSSSNGESSSSNGESSSSNGDSSSDHTFDQINRDDSHDPVDTNELTIDYIFGDIDDSIVTIPLQSIEADDEWNESLYDGSDLTVGMFVYIMVFNSMKHHETIASLASKLLLFNKIVPQPNRVPPTVYKLRSLYLRYQNQMTCHVVCCNGDSIFPIDSLNTHQCDVCGERKSNGVKLYVSDFKSFLCSFLNISQNLRQVKDFNLRNSAENVIGMDLQRIYDEHPHLNGLLTTIWGFSADGMLNYCILHSLTSRC